MAIILNAPIVEIRPVTAPVQADDIVLYCNKLPLGFYAKPGEWGIRG